MRISDWSSDVCSSDLRYVPIRQCLRAGALRIRMLRSRGVDSPPRDRRGDRAIRGKGRDQAQDMAAHRGAGTARSEEHTSELQSLMRISYAVFCLKKKKNKT